MWESAPRRAWNDTVLALKTVGYSWVASIILMVVGGVLLPTFIPSSSTIWQSVVLTVGGGLLGLITPALLILLWNFYSAPYRQRDEARKLVNAEEEVDAPTAIIRSEPFIGDGMAQLRITNLGSSTIKCQGEMKEITPEPSKPEALPYAIKWKVSSTSFQSTGITEIISGASSVLEIVRHTSSNSNRRTATLRLLSADGLDNGDVVAKFNEPVFCRIAFRCEPPLAENLVETFEILDNGQLDDFKKAGTS